jgi:DNA-binding NtrC family response regulator
MNAFDVVRVSLPLAAAHRLNSDRRSARAILERARSRCLALEDAPLLASVSVHLGALAIECGELRAAKSAYEFAAKASELTRSEKRAVRSTLGLAMVALRQGEDQLANSLATRAIEGAVRLDLRREQVQALEYTAGALALQGDEYGALAALDSAIEMGSALSGSSDLLIELHRSKAETQLRFRDYGAARMHFDLAAKHAEVASEPEDTLALERIEAVLMWVQGDRETSLQTLRRHDQSAKVLGFQYEQLLTMHEITFMLDSEGKVHEAAEWWARTEFLAESCGALPLLERWRREREELGFASPRPTDDSADTIDDSPASTDDEPPLSPISKDLPRVNLEEHGIITRSSRLQEQSSWIAKVAPSGVPVLIRGQSGTGKELFAQMVHSLSGRKEGPFLAINCGALPAEIMESELFGHRRGAFTGAIFDKPGLFREAHEGTLFLDEIGEMTASAQAKLLRVIETGEFRPVGGTRYEKADVRIVAATNADLDKGVREGQFRKDLYFRLRGLEIYLPPLRDQLSDIAPLTRYFLDRLNRRYGRRQKLGFETVQWLMGQPWPGNIRELRLAMERASALAPSEADLKPEHFIGLSGSTESSSLPEELEEIERARVLNALEASDWNTSAAARLLGMSRTTLTGRIKKLGIEKPRSR